MSQARTESTNLQMAVINNITSLMASFLRLDNFKEYLLALSEEELLNLNNSLRQIARDYLDWIQKTATPSPQPRLRRGRRLYDKRKKKPPLPYHTRSSEEESSKQ